MLLTRHVRKKLGLLPLFVISPPSIVKVCSVTLIVIFGCQVNSQLGDLPRFCRPLPGDRLYLLLEHLGIVNGRLVEGSEHYPRRNVIDVDFVGCELERFPETIFVWGALRLLAGASNCLSTGGTSRGYWSVSTISMWTTHGWSSTRSFSPTEGRTMCGWG